MNKQKFFTRNRIFGLIGTVWGGSVLLGKLLGDGQVVTNSAYAAGQTVGLIFGGLLFVVGLYYLIKG